MLVLCPSPAFDSCSPISRGPGTTRPHSVTLGSPSRSNRAPTGVGSTARLEDERPRGRGRLSADRAVVEHDEAAIEEFARLDGEPRVGASAAQLRAAGTDADGVVPGHDAAIAAAEHEGQIGRRAPPHGLRGGWGLAEAAVEIGDELGQVRDGCRDGREAAEPELADETIL